ncbi:unnamed protein product [Rotaria socialis]|uniref:Uncharacterized protein n=1 Tax=Rotaria socialis TaxID=392032 RepID=A0A821SD55_9BILA|nr:unnamed protein product [Rotaria socialis]
MHGLDETGDLEKQQEYTELDDLKMTGQIAQNLIKCQYRTSTTNTMMMAVEINDKTDLEFNVGFRYTIDFLDKSFEEIALK